MKITRSLLTIGCGSIVPSPRWGEGQGEGVMACNDSLIQIKSPHPVPLPVGARGRMGTGIGGVAA